MSRSTKKTNAVSTDAGIEIYPDDMHIYAQEYEDSLPHPENLYKLSSSTFTGLIRYINKKMGFTRAIYDDINLLDDIWDMYIDIAYKYDQKPVLEEFALLIGCSRDILYSYARIQYNPYSGQFFAKTPLISSGIELNVIYVKLELTH